MNYGGIKPFYEYVKNSVNLKKGQGKVIVQFIIDVDGKTAEIKTLESTNLADHEAMLIVMKREIEAERKVIDRMQNAYLL